MGNYFAVTKLKLCYDRVATIYSGWAAAWRKLSCEVRISKEEAVAQCDSSAFLLDAMARNSRIRAK